MRVRFTTSHPKDMSDDTLRVIAGRTQCVPAYPFAGAERKQPYLEIDEPQSTPVNGIWTAWRPFAGLCRIALCPQTFFSGYCSETEEDHEMSLSLMRNVPTTALLCSSIRSGRERMPQAFARRRAGGREGTAFERIDRFAE